MTAQPLSRAEARLIHSLHRRKAREAQGFFLAEGLRVVEELVASKLTIRLAILSSELEDNPRGRALLERLSQRTEIRIVPEHVVREVAATENPQGVLAIAGEPEDTLASIVPQNKSNLLVCDGIQDPGNLGTLIRIADAFSLDGVLLLPGTVDAWNAKVVRSAAGSSFRVPLVAAEWPESMEWLRARSYRTLGAETSGQPLDLAALPSRIALVVGNEGAGLRADVRSSVDQLVRVEMPGPAESLNVAVAAGILLYALTSGRR